MTAPRKVLIVDDNVDAARMLELLLETLGFAPRMAMSGAEALAVAAEQRPDIVLLDLSLPDTDGFELAPRLRAIAGLEHVKLVAVTGWSDPEAAAKARSLGFEGFLVKPVDFGKLEAALG